MNFKQKETLCRWEVENKVFQDLAWGHLLPESSQVSDFRTNIWARQSPATLLGSAEHFVALTMPCVHAPSCPIFLWLQGLEPTRLLSPWNVPGRNTGVGCYFLLQGILPTQGSNLSSVSCSDGWILYQLHHLGSTSYNAVVSLIQVCIDLKGNVEFFYRRGCNAHQWSSGYSLWTQ